jgi:hypothetical protein
MAKAEAMSAALPDGSSSRSERRAYLFRQIVSHLAASEDWPRLFDLIENRGFLADQAEAFGDFGPSTDDMENHAVPAALRLADWDRFLHFSLLALNLRGLAEALTDPRILQALAQGGQHALAQGAAARLAEPVRRASARASLAMEDSSQLLQQVTEDLDAAPAPDPEGREEAATALCAIARSLGPDLQDRWEAWIDRLIQVPADARRIWRALAESWLERGDPDAPGLWQALEKVDDPQALLEFAPSRLGRLRTADPAAVLGYLQALFGEDSHRWQAAALFLGQWVEHDEAAAFALWEKLAAASPVPWSAALADAGRGLFGRLGPERLERLAGAVNDPATRAALYVVALEHRPVDRLAAAALDAVQRIPGPEERLHWSLRYLAARPPGAEVRGQVGAVLHYLADLRYLAPAPDLARYLDLVARFHPQELRYEVENALWSPAGKPEILRTLVERAEEQEVLRNVLEHAERYAAAVAPTEAEGFQLRGEVLIRVACRLCLVQGGLQFLPQAVERLLPEEEDELRSSLARALAEATEADPPPAERLRQICDGIHDPRRRLLARLEALPPADRPKDLLQPASLYQATASIAALEDERLGLSALLDRPLQLQELAARTVSRMRDRERQNQALLRLAWHALGFESSFFGKRQDRAAAIELVRGSLAVGSDLRLAALTPEIARLGAQRGGSLAVAEFQEAARRLLSLDTVPWPRRLAALEAVLADAASVLDSPKRVAAVVETVARLPAEMEDGAAREEVRRLWHEVLPRLVALADRLPDKTAQTLARSLRAGAQAAAGSSRSVLELCLASPEERRLRAERLLREESPDPDVLRALPFLLARFGRPSGLEPEVLSAVERLPADASRDELCLRLIRHGWVRSETAERLAGLVQGPDLQVEARVWLGLQPGPGSPAGDSWLQDLAALVSRGGADPSDPAFEPLLARLWQQDPEKSEQALGQAVVEALPAGGRARGEAALRLWLHAHLSPRPGLPQPERLRRCADLEGVMRRALDLSPGPSTQEVPEPPVDFSQEASILA